MSKSPPPLRNKKQRKEKDNQTKIEFDVGSSDEDSDEETPHHGDRQEWKNELNKFYAFEPKEFIPGIQPKISLFSTITLFGKRKTGKSVWIKWFLQSYKRFFPWIWVFTKTKLNDHYLSFIPGKFILTEFDANMLQKIMDRQKKALELRKKDDEMDPRAVIIWDDYSGNDIRFNTKLAEYYYTGRHYMTMNLFGAQNLTLVPPSIRSNSDIVILFNSDFGDSCDGYWKDFAGKMDKYQFYNWFQKYCGNVKHGFLAIINDPNCPPEEKFFYGVADEIDVGMDSILGCREYWSGSEKQLTEIIDGTLKKNIELIHDLADPDSEENKRKKEDIVPTKVSKDPPQDKQKKKK